MSEDLRMPYQTLQVAPRKMRGILGPVRGVLSSRERIQSADVRQRELCVTGYENLCGSDFPEWILWDLKYI